MSRHTITYEHAECCCVHSLCNLHWHPPKSHICTENSTSYELYWLPADPTSGCPVDERNPRAVMIGAVIDEVPRILELKGVSLSLWRSLTGELLNDSPPTTVYFGLMVVPICFAFPCAVANCLRLRSWNSFMSTTVEKYKSSFRELGIDLEWHAVWLPSEEYSDESNGKHRHQGCGRFDDKGGPTLRFIFEKQ
jgi:hypothetical protein